MTGETSDEIALLEEERDFLLRSLDDLERERSEGNVAPDDYERLHDDYTARAAAALRAIRDGVDTRPSAPPVPWRRRLPVVAGVVAFAVVAALLLGRSLGERLPGGSVTGNQQIGNEPADSGGSPSEPGRGLDELAAAVADDPDDADVRIAYADALLGEGRAADALRQYDAAADSDPTSARARASAGFVVFQAGLVDEALERLDAAEAADPTYADTFFMRGIVLLRGSGDAAGAGDAFTHYLELAPEGTYAADVEVILEQIRRDADQGA